MLESEYWQTTQPQWEAYQNEYLERLRFVDLQFATIRQMLYTTSNTEGKLPHKPLNSFLLLAKEDTRSPEEVGEELMHQMMGLMNL